MMREEWMNKAAQLWCLPEHSSKVMDSEFAMSIAEALQSAHDAGAAQERAAILTPCDPSCSKCSDFLDTTHRSFPAAPSAAKPYPLCQTCSVSMGRGEHCARCHGLKAVSTAAIKFPETCKPCPSCAPAEEKR